MFILWGLGEIIPQEKKYFLFIFLNDFSLVFIIMNQAPVIEMKASFGLRDLASITTTNPSPDYIPPNWTRGAYLETIAGIIQGNPVQQNYYPTNPIPSKDEVKPCECPDGVKEAQMRTQWRRKIRVLIFLAVLLGVILGSLYVETKTS